MSPPYSSIFALDSNYFNVCIYCGCEATQSDYVPPQKYADVYGRHYAVSYRMVVPCCVECAVFLGGSHHHTLELRSEFVRKKIAAKYKKSLRIYKSWDDDELGGLSPALRKSVLAGIELGRDAYARITFSGYAFEYEGQRSFSPLGSGERYTVLGTEFDSLRDALLFVSRSYRINIHQVERYFVEEGGLIEEVVKRHLAEMNAASAERELKNKCKAFCEKFSQSQAFVEKTVKVYMKRYPESDVVWCLDKIYEERISGKK